MLGRSGGPGRSGVPGAPESVTEAIRGHEASGSRTSRINSSSASVGARVVGTSPTTPSSKPGLLDDFFDAHTRMDRTEPHAMVGCGEIEHTEVRHDEPDLVEPARPCRALAARS